MNRPNKELPFGLPVEPQGSVMEPPAVPRVSNTRRPKILVESQDGGGILDPFPPGVAEQIDKIAAEMKEEDFQWSPENEDVIVPEQRSIAVYKNRWDQAVIRCERGWNDDDDTWIIISMESVPAVIAKLRALVDAGDH